MTPAVTEAIEAVYGAFSDARAPSAIDACPCCHEPTEYCALVRLPLRELTHEHLSGYAFSVFYTVGDRPDFEYLFPRMLELTMQDAEFGTDRAIVFKKPGLAGWPVWRKDRRLAFQRYLDAVIASFGDHPWKDDSELDSWVCSLGFCVDDLASRLNVFLGDTPAAVANLTLFYEANSDALMKRRLSNAFWERDGPNYQQVLAWFEQPAVQRRIQDVYGM